MTKNLMYSFVADERPNPLGGKCYGCSYCYIHGTKGMKIRFKHIRDKYSGEFRLYPKILERIRNIRNDKPVFFCDCIDYLHKDNTKENILDIFWHIKNNRHDTIFLSLTKNPIRYIEFIKHIPENMILGVTEESNINYPIYSNAPLQTDRMLAMTELNIVLDYNSMNNKTFWSIEPALMFDYNSFLEIIENCNPTYGVALGYDNHKHKLNEPPLKDILSLRKDLMYSGFKIIDKTIRKAWWEK